MKHKVKGRAAEILPARFAKVFGLCAFRMAISSRFEEELVRVGAMNRRVAHRAGLIFLCQIVESRRRSGTCIHREGMALKAQQVHLSAFEQVRIR